MHGSVDVASRGVGRIGLVLAISIVVVLAPFVAPRTAQPASRYALTAALVDHRTVNLDRYRSVLEIDHAVFRGHLRSDKGPGQPVLATPFYAVARMFGAPPLNAHTPVRRDLMLWWLTLTTATIPFALLCVLAYRRAAAVSRRDALIATIAMMVGSIALPHAVNLYAHSLSALFGFASYAVVAEPRVMNIRNLVASGFFVGLAIATEYHLAIVGIVIAIAVLVRARRQIGYFVLGSALPLGGLAWYQARAFGVPWHTPFAYYAGTLGGTTRGGYSMPSLDGIAATLISNRGLMIVCPIVVIGAVCAALQCRRQRLRFDDATIGLIIFVAYVGLVAGWSGTRFLEEPGPRYLIPAIPFLVTPLAVQWSRLPRVANLVGLWSAALMIGATSTFLLVAISDTPINAIVNRVAQHRFLPTIWSMAFGNGGVVFYLGSVVAALHWLHRCHRQVSKHAFGAATVATDERHDHYPWRERTQSSQR